MKSIALSLFACLMAVNLSAQEQFLKTQPVTSSEYQVSVNGKSVPVYTAKEEFHDGIYFFTTFDFKSTANVVVSSTHDLSHVQLLPSKYKFAVKKYNAHKVSFKADKPFRLSFEHNGRLRPLLVFGNRPDKKVYAAGQPDVIYFGPGVHHAGRIVVRSGQTLYLADGAIVNGSVWLQGDDITVCGKGILTGDDWKRFHGPGSYMFFAYKCRNLTLRDITITNSWTWTCVLSGCDRVLIDNIKVCCSNMINDDAVDICNSRNVSVKNCFLRAQDDIIAVKGIPQECMSQGDPDKQYAQFGTTQLPQSHVSHHASSAPISVCENISVENCELWTDKANIFRIGYECGATDMRNIIGRHLYVVHYSFDFRPPEHYWCNAIFYLQPSNAMRISCCRFEDITINADGCDLVVLAAKCGLTSGPDSAGESYKTSGTLSNVLLKNISVCGNPNHFNGALWLQGASLKESISDFRFNNIRYFGHKLKPSAGQITANEYASYTME
jgi:hypothetical protein